MKEFFHTIDSFLEYVGVNLPLIVAGIFGSVVTIGNKEELTGVQKVLTILSGGAIANYLTPMLCDLINVSENTQFGFAFLLGFSGLEGVKWIIIQLKSRYGKDKKE